MTSFTQDLAARFVPGLKRGDTQVLQASVFSEGNNSGVDSYSDQCSTSHLRYASLCGTDR